MWQQKVSAVDESGKKVVSAIKADISLLVWLRYTVLDELLKSVRMMMGILQMYF